MSEAWESISAGILKKIFRGALGGIVGNNRGTMGEILSDASKKK